MDGVQFVELNQVTPETFMGSGDTNPASVRSSLESADALKAKACCVLKFHYTRRMADILREEAETEARIKAEKEAIE